MLSPPACRFWRRTCFKEIFLSGKDKVFQTIRKKKSKMPSLFVQSRHPRCCQVTLVELHNQGERGKPSVNWTTRARYWSTHFLVILLQPSWRGEQSGQTVKPSTTTHSGSSFHPCTRRRGRIAEQPGQTAVFYKGQYNRLKSFPRKLHFMKINISQARACFGKLLISKMLHESFCLILIN